MFEARLEQGKLLKQLADAIKELVSEANFECTTEGISMQAMDSSHVCLVVMRLDQEGFSPYRCDKTKVLGISMESLVKVLKCVSNEDIVSLRAHDDEDRLTLLFESPAQDRVSDFSLKLMEIEMEQMAVPEQEYSAQVKIPAAEYAGVIKNLASIGDTVNISVTKDGIKFSASGDIGTANVTLRHNPHAGGGGGGGHGSGKKGKADADLSTIVELNEPVSLNFSIRYLVSFSKAASLSTHVTLTMTKDLPLMVEFRMEGLGWLRYYLAPKVEDEEEGAPAGDQPMGDDD